MILNKILWRIKHHTIHILNHTYNMCPYIFVHNTLCSLPATGKKVCQVLLWVDQSVEHTKLGHYIPKQKWYIIDPSRIGFMIQIRWTRDVVMEILNVLKNEISQLRNTIRHCFITRAFLKDEFTPLVDSWVGLVKFRELAS